MKKYPNYDINLLIREMNVLYEREVLDGFIKNDRFDLLFGYAVTDKGAIIEDNQIKFYKEDTFNRNTGGLRQYVDQTTQAIAKVFDIVKNDMSVEPNCNWRSEALKYVSKRFLMKYQEVENMIIEKGKTWDMIAFAEHVPHANLDRIETELLKEADSLKLLAYSMDVKLADKDKIRKALEQICKRDGAIGSEVDYETRELHRQHFMQFKNLFGSGKRQAENE